MAVDGQTGNTSASCPLRFCHLASMMLATAVQACLFWVLPISHTCHRKYPRQSSRSTVQPMEHTAHTIAIRVMVRHLRAHLLCLQSPMQGPLKQPLTDFSQPFVVNALQFGSARHWEASWAIFLLDSSLRSQGGERPGYFLQSTTLRCDSTKPGTSSHSAWVSGSLFWLV